MTCPESCNAPSKVAVSAATSHHLQVAALDSKLSQALPTEIGQKSRKLEQLEREAAEPQRSREVGFSISGTLNKNIEKHVFVRSGKNGNYFMYKTSKPEELVQGMHLHLFFWGGIQYARHCYPYSGRCVGSLLSRKKGGDI